MAEDIQFVSQEMGLPLSERWYLDHMGVMAFWRTVLGGVNLLVGIIIALKVFEVV